MCVCVYVRASSGSLQAYSGDQALGEKKKNVYLTLTYVQFNRRKKGGEGQGSYR